MAEASATHLLSDGSAPRSPSQNAPGLSSPSVGGSTLAQLFSGLQTVLNVLGSGCYVLGLRGMQHVFASRSIASSRCLVLLSVWLQSGALCTLLSDFIDWTPLLFLHDCLEPTVIIIRQ